MPHETGAQFWFRSSRFEIEPGEDEETNPFRYGRQLANWMRAELIARGYTVEEVIPEDWGWCVMCSRKPFMLWVGCGSVHDETFYAGKFPPRGRDVVWTCFVTAEKPLFVNPFKKLDAAPALNQLSGHIESILRAEPEIELTEEP